jgi:hypothetical protein
LEAPGYYNIGIMQYAKIGFLIASIAMFPLEMIPCKNSIEELFFKENKMTSN